MGCCLSCSKSLNADQNPPSAYVVSINGQLRLFPLPITVSKVLYSSDSSCFICNSDALCFEDYIPSLQSEQELEPWQVYFVLPNAMLKQRLAPSDMAALAVKASAALHQISASTRNKTRISPVLLTEEEENPQSNHTVNNYTKKKFDNDDQDNVVGKMNKKKTPNLVSRSGSVRKLTRYSSQRAKLAVRSFRMKLTTIYEGSVLHPIL